MSPSVLRCLWVSMYLFLLPADIFSQCIPLVPNGGFEEYSSLPNDDCGWALATGWTNAATSSDCNTNNGTPDYFHLQGTGEFASLPLNYFSEVNPFEGSAVMGVGGYISSLPNSREYISIALTSPLVVGNEYTISFSMTIGSPQVGGYYTDGWGIILTTGEVFQPTGTNGPITPTGSQFIVPGVFTSETWQTYSFTFVADQAYDQLTFGNFFTDLEQNPSPYGNQGFISLAYVFVDDFQIEDPNLTAPIVNLGADFELCQNQTILDATTVGGLSYLWNNGATSPTLTINAAGLYYVDVEWACGLVRDSIEVFNCPELTLSLGPNIEVCPDATVTIEAAVLGGIQPYNFEWSVSNAPNSNSLTFSPQASGTVSLLVTDAIGNEVSDDLMITLSDALDDINLGSDGFICPDQTVYLDATVAGAIAYQWSNGSTSNAIVISGPGTYIVEAFSECASTTDTIFVYSGVSDIPEFATEVQLCYGNNVEIGPAFESNSFVEWVDDSSAPFPRPVDSPGEYSFVFNDLCSTRTLNIEVTSDNCVCDIFIPNSFTPNDDGSNDYFAPVCNCNFSSYDFRIYNRWGDELFRSTDPNEKWIGNGQNQSKYFVPDGVYVWTLAAESFLAGNELKVYNLSGTVTLFR